MTMPNDPPQEPETVPSPSPVGAPPPSGGGVGPSAAPAPPVAPQPGPAQPGAGALIGLRAEQLGHEAEAAAQRLAANPDVRAAGDVAARAWGLVLLAIGVWFFLRVTLDLPVPGIAWAELWPILLIGLGLLVIVRGRRRA